MATLFDTRTKERRETFRDFFGVEEDRNLPRNPWSGFFSLRI